MYNEMDEMNAMGSDTMMGVQADPALLVDWAHKLLNKYMDTKLLLIAEQIKNKKEKYGKEMEGEEEDYEMSASEKFAECLDWKNAKLEEFITMLGGQAMTEEDLMMEEGDDEYEM